MMTSNTLRRLGAIGLAALIIAAASPAPASAQATRQEVARPAARVGNVAQPTATGFTLESRQGTLTVTISDATWIVVQKEGRAQEGTPADLVAGKPAAVAGMLSLDGKSLAARTVAQGPAAQRLADRLARSGRKPLRTAMQHVGSGTITAIDGARITLRGERTNEVTVVTRPETLVLRGGFSELSTLKVGEKVQVLGVPVRPAASSTDGTPTRTLEAWALRVDSGATGFYHGRVARVDGNTLVVNNVRGRDRITISIDAGTQYKRITIVNAAPVIAAASLADVRPGGYLAVEGVVSPDGRTIQARAVMLLGSPLDAGN